MTDARTPRVEPYGDDAVLVELPGLAEVRALDDAVRAARATDPDAAGIVDQVPAARTLLLRVRADADPGVLPVGRWWAARTEPSARTEAPEVVLRVDYDGPDLADVARLTGLTVDEVVARHTGAQYTVAFGGFMAGFAYLVGLDPALRVPRLDSPRERVPAGSVAIADEYSAVYPAATPGGWRLLGRCGQTLFDVDREPSGAAAARHAGAVHGLMTGALEVLDPGLLTLVEDLGRPGWAHIGVGRSGAADAGALRLANRLVANDEGAAGLEVLLGGLRLRAVGDVTVALAGARGPTWLDDRPVGHEAVLELRSGTELRLGTVTSGLRTYVAVRGGIDVPTVLGSRSTDQLAGLGPAPVRAGDVLPVGPAPAGWPVVDLAPVPDQPDRVELPVVPGPHADWFDDVLARLQAGEWHVTPATNRVAVRLTGPALARTPDATGRELPSEGLVLGAVQVPPDGQPVVFGVDHPVTGGYPVVAVVRRYAHGRLAQVRPGDRVSFVHGLGSV